MRLIDTFLYSDSDEFPLITTKILSEASLVDLFLIVEGSHTFKGQPKAFTIRKLLNSEKKLLAVRNKIKVIEFDLPKIDTLSGILRHSSRFAHQIYSGIPYRRARRAFKERNFLTLEELSRNVAVPYLIEWGLKHDDWILVTDSDEILDLANDRRMLLLRELLNSDFPIHHLIRRRYMFDFDNYDPRPRTIPLIKGNIILDNDSVNLTALRVPNNGLIQSPTETLVFEFSSCFPLDAIIRKHEFARHQTPSRDAIINAVERNHAIVYQEDRARKLDFFTKIKPSLETHPTIILREIESLKTGNVPDDYIYKRQQAYPELFS